MPGKTAAVFDFDGTLIKGNAAFWFVQSMVRNRLVSLKSLIGILPAACSYFLGHRTKSTTVGILQHLMQGRARADIARMAKRFAEEDLKPRIYPETKKISTHHLDCGHFFVIATAAPRFAVEDTAFELGCNYLLCTEFEIVADRFTGAVSDKPCWGNEKLKKLLRLARDADLNLAISYAYSNDFSDVGLLSHVGHPCVVNPDLQLKKTAQRRQWTSLKFGV